MSTGSASVARRWGGGTWRAMRRGPPPSAGGGREPRGGAARALAELGDRPRITVTAAASNDQRPQPLPAPRPVELPRYEVGGSVATREAYGDVLRALGGARPAAG